MKFIHKMGIKFAGCAKLIAIALIVAALSSPGHAHHPDSADNPPDDEASTSVDSGGTVENKDGEKSAIDRRYLEEQKVKSSAFGFTPHRPNYFLIVNYESNSNTDAYDDAGEAVPKNYEAKFQFSFKKQFLEEQLGDNVGLYFAYTQRSCWQIYDTILSSPFRDTNYEPELFMRFNTGFNVLGLKSRFINGGVNHQSNGRGEPLSRSWNRIFVDFIAERGSFAVSLKPWYRIPESEDDDDNPNIEKYYGYGELLAAYTMNEHVLSMKLRNNLRANDNRGAVEIGLSIATRYNVKIYLTYFNGYGESLIDYNKTASRFGLGVMLTDWI